jgi:nucleoside-diphosphate-sugar epimerase
MTLAAVFSEARTVERRGFFVDRRIAGVEARTPAAGSEDLQDDDQLAESDRSFAGTRVLITGGMGFLGGHVAKRLVGLGAEVTVFDLDVSSARPSIVNDPGEGLHSRLSLVRGDIRLAADLRAVLAHPFDYVFHFAAYSVIEHSTQHPVDTIQTNALGVVNLLEVLRHAAWRPKSITFASTDKVYGEMGTSSYSEESPLRGIGVYDAAKLAGDVFARMYNEVFGLPTVVMRLCNVFGPHDHNVAFRLIPKALARIYEGDEPEPPVLYYDSLNHWRDYIYVDDAVDAFLLVGSRTRCHGHVYNVAAATHAPTPQVLKDLVDCAAALESSHDPKRRAAIEHNGIRVEMRNGVPGVVAIDRQHLDGSKLRALGFVPKTSFADGLTQTVTFYRAHYRCEGGSDRRPQDRSVDRPLDRSMDREHLVHA